MTAKSLSLRKPVTLTEFFLQWEWILVLLLVLTSLLNAALSPYFLNLRNIADTTFTFMERGIMTLPMTFVIMTGGIDLSVASNLAMTTSLMGKLFMGGMNIWTAAAIALVVATLAGLFNGLIITRIKLPPIAATLGTYVLYRGIAWILLQDGAATNLPASFNALGQGYVPGTAIPIPLIIYIVLVIPFGLLLHRTTFGRFTYAYGNNKEACRYSGVNTDRLMLIIFTLSGLIAGIAGIMMAGRFGSVRADIANGAELDVITAVVLGGVDINGGSGGIIGVILALFLLGELRYGMNLLNVAPQSQIIVTGFLLIISIIVPQLVRRLTTARTTPAPTAGGARRRPAFTWALAGVGAVIVLLAVVLATRSCSAPPPGSGAPPAAGPAAAGTPVTAAPTAAEIVLQPTNTPVPPPPTRTPRPTSTARPTDIPSPTTAATAAPTAAPSEAASATTAATDRAGTAAEPTRTPIVMAMLPTPGPTAAGSGSGGGQPESDMLEISGGAFTMGANDGNQNETPVHQVDAPAFLMDHFEVTNGNYAAFAQATGYKTGPEQSGANKTWRSYFTPDKADHPVVKVNYADAEAYCKWAGKRLPTEVEWEKAARGADQRSFPWGNLWDASLANVRQTGLRGTAAVGSFPKGASPYGVEDLAGNVGEWTSSAFAAYPGSGYRDPQYRPEARVTRGGGWFDDAKQVRTSARNGAMPGTANDDLGFRCAADKK